MTNTSPGRIAALVMVLAANACGSSRLDTKAVAAPAGCPAAYADVSVGAACEDEAQSCGYAEGRCWCGPRSYCGGVEPPQELLEELRKPTWQCEPIRTDGCPEAPPSGTCSEPGRACHYGECCVQAVTCTAGNWVPGQMSCPP